MRYDDFKLEDKGNTYYLLTIRAPYPDDSKHATEPFFDYEFDVNTAGEKPVITAKNYKFEHPFFEEKKTLMIDKLFKKKQTVFTDHDIFSIFTTLRDLLVSIFPLIPVSSPLINQKGLWLYPEVKKTHHKVHPKTAFIYCSDSNNTKIYTSLNNLLKSTGTGNSRKHYNTLCFGPLLYRNLKQNLNESIGKERLYNILWNVKIEQIKQTPSILKIVDFTLAYQENFVRKCVQGNEEALKYSKFRDDYNLSMCAFEKNKLALLYTYNENIIEQALTFNGWLLGDLKKEAEKEADEKQLKILQKQYLQEIAFFSKFEHFKFDYKNETDYIAHEYDVSNNKIIVYTHSKNEITNKKTNLKGLMGNEIIIQIEYNNEQFDLEIEKLIYSCDSPTEIQPLLQTSSPEQLLLPKPEKNCVFGKRFDINKETVGTIGFIGVNNKNNKRYLATAGHALSNHETVSIEITKNVFHEGLPCESIDCKEGEIFLDIGVVELSEEISLINTKPFMKIIELKDISAKIEQFRENEIKVIKIGGISGNEESKISHVLWKKDVGNLYVDLPKGRKGDSGSPLLVNIANNEYHLLGTFIGKILKTSMGVFMTTNSFERFDVKPLYTVPFITRITNNVIVNPLTTLFKQYFK